MAEKNIKDNELSGEPTTQKKKSTSKKKADSENIKTPRTTAKRKAKAAESDEASIKKTAETVVEASAEETAEAVVETVAEETAEAVVEAPAEETAEAVVEASEEETAEAVVEASEGETVEAVIEPSAEETPEALVEDEEKEEALPSPIMEIEHFSDYKSVKTDELENEQEQKEQAEEEVTASEVGVTEEEEAQDLPNEENLPDAEEYENLTILDHGLFTEAIRGESENAAKENNSLSREENEDPDSKKYDPKKPRRVDGRFEFIELFVFTLVAVMLITTFLFRHSVVEGESMENTLFANEHLIITDVFYKPKAGDIVVFEDYSTGYKTAIVKRVIATEGQTVRIAAEGVYVDGVFLDNEYYVQIDTENYNYLTNVDSRFIEDYTIPEGEVFVLGDHRDRSSDSRTFGTIGEETILGKVILRFYPFDKFGSVYKDN